MADLSVTAASVVPDSGYINVDGIAGTTITAGQVVYQKASDSFYYLADANATSPTEIHQPAGVAMQSVSVGQPLKIMSGGTYTVGATVAAGAVYVLSGTPGGIAPVADLATGWFTTLLMIGISTTKARISILQSGVAVP